MFSRSIPLLTSALLLVPGVSSAQSLTCPVVAEVFASDGAAGIVVSVPQLADIVAGGTLSDQDLREVAATLRVDYPKAGDAEIADLMIAGYCAYLRDVAPSAQKTQANMEKFENRIYNAVFGSPTPPRNVDRGWLFD